MPTKYIILVFCLFSMAARGQQSSYEDFMNMLETNNSKEAIVLGQKLMQDYEAEGTLDTSYTNVAANVAYLFYAENRPAEAYQTGLQCQIAMANMGDTLTEDFSDIVYYNAIYASYASQFESACQHLEHVLKIKDYLGIANDESTFSIRWQLANMYAGFNHELAEVNYKWSENYTTNVYGPLDSMRMVVSNTIASFYFTTGRFDKAEPYYTSACELMKDNYGVNSQAYILSLNALGEFYIYAGDDASAYKTFKETARLTKKVFGEESTHYATALNNLAVATDNLHNYEEAIGLYEKVLGIKAAIYTTESDYYALSLMNLGAVYEKIGAAEEAKKWLEKALDIYEKLDTDAQTNHSVTLSHYSSVLATLGDYENARKADLKALELQERVYGKQQAGYCNALQRYAMNLITYGDYDLAKQTFEECLDLQAEVIGRNHPSYATTLLYLSQVSSELGEIEKALDYVNQALVALEQVHGKNSVEYARALNTLANIQFQEMDYAACRQTYNQCLKLARHVFGSNHLERATILNNYGLFNTAIGDYAEAEKQLLTALKIQNHPDNQNLLATDLIFTYTNLANNYMFVGDYGLAEKNLIKAYDIAKARLPKNHPDFARILDNRAKVYAEIGLIDQATNFYDQAINIHSEVYGENSQAVAGVLNNKATAHLYAAQMQNEDVQKMQKHAETATELLYNSIGIGKRGMGERDLSAEFNNLAECYRVLGIWDSAIYYYDKSMEEERRLGKDESSVAITLHNKAMTYLVAGYPEDALQLANQGIEIRESKFRKNHHSLQNAYLSKGQILVFMNDHEAAVKEYARVMGIFKKELERNFSYFSEREKLNWLKTNQVSLTQFRRFAYAYRHKHPAFFADLVKLELQLSSMLLRSNDQVKSRISQSGDQALLQSYQNWQDAKKEMSTLLNQGLSESSDKYKSLEESIRVQEKQLSEQLGDGNFYLNEIDESFIHKKLQTNERYVQFLSFIPNDSVAVKSYYALIYSPELDLPEFVQLFSEDEFTKLIDETASTRKKGIDELYGQKGRLNVSLGKLIFDSLQTHLNEAEKIYFTPSGVLHKIAFGALSVDGESYLSDKVGFHEVVDPLAWFSRSDEQQPELRTFELIGGVDYGDENGDWAYLEGTKTEVEAIHQIILEHQLKDELLLDVSATETSLKSALQNKKPDVLHLASHGFFYPDPEEIVTNSEELTTDLVFRGSSASSSLSQSADPMKRAGLVLAGANTTNHEGEDGILSAYEVSLLDLSHTKLTVLSACETGLGDVTGSEGVFGLQRAFMMAGVENMVLSLWQVPDKETSEFMVVFYENLCSGLAVEEAFRKTQNHMKALYDPYFWAAFVLVR